MKTLLLALLLACAPLAFVAGTTGCTTSQKAVAYKSLMVVASSVDAAMRAFADAVVAGKVGAATQAEVRDLHGRYSKAMQAAVAAARFDTASPTPDTVQALASQLLSLITSVVKGTP